jgi:hypothetical protein
MFRNQVSWMSGENEIWIPQVSSDNSGNLGSSLGDQHVVDENYNY